MASDDDDDDVDVVTDDDEVPRPNINDGTSDCLRGELDNELNFRKVYLLEKSKPHNNCEINKERYADELNTALLVADGDDGLSVLARNRPDAVSCGLNGACC